MITAGLISLIVFLSVGWGFTLFYLVRFARIIWSIEDAISNGLQVFDDVDKTIDGLLGMQLFFDSKEVQQTTKAALDEVRLAKLAVARVIQDFTQLSKQKYEIIEEEEEDIDDYHNYRHHEIPKKEERV